jgi:hypothetical protein
MCALELALPAFFEPRRLSATACWTEERSGFLNAEKRRSFFMPTPIYTCHFEGLGASRESQDVAQALICFNRVSRFNLVFSLYLWNEEEDEMKENWHVSISREAAELVLDLLSPAETPPCEKKDALRDIIRAALDTPALESAKEESRINLAQAIDELAQAESAFVESLAHGSESVQRMASAAVDAQETRLRGAQAMYDAAAGNALEATAESAERNRRLAYTKSEKAHDEALAALRAFEPMAQELSKLFRILSFHADLALADTEAADRARISPHAANAADHLQKILQQQKLGHSEAVTKHALAALHELELAQ